MPQTLLTARLTLAFEPDIETVTGTGSGRCGIYYVWLGDQHLGALSLTSVSRDCGEIGYEINETFRGHGFASEAVGPTWAPFIGR